MKPMRKLALPLLLLLALALPAAAGAQGIDPIAADETTLQSSEPIESASRLGVLAAVGCGFMVRATIATAGTQAGTWAGALACCGFALFDALTEPAAK